nr:hypothetical protein [Caulobacter sp. 17J65-9]
MKAAKGGDGPGALRHWTPLAQLGSKEAQRLVGQAYAFGWGDIPKDSSRAMYWFRRCGPRCGYSTVDDEQAKDPAAAQALIIAKAFAAGASGGPPDLAESAKWLRLAADGGSQEAAAMLAEQRRAVGAPEAPATGAAADER